MLTLPSCNEFSLFCLELKLKQNQMVWVFLLVEDLSVPKHPIHPDVDVRLTRFHVLSSHGS